MIDAICTEILGGGKGRCSNVGDYLMVVAYNTAILTLL